MLGCVGDRIPMLAQRKPNQRRICARLRGAIAFEDALTQDLGCSGPSGIVPRDSRVLAHALILDAGGCAGGASGSE